MKLTKDEFKKLQREWYQKLADLGFKDIEEFKGEELVLKESYNDCFRPNRHNKSEFDRSMQEEYFRCLAHKAFDETTVYRNEIDKHILIRYSEGAKIKTIITELSVLKKPLRRNTIRFIIKRYEMAWGLKNYKPNELNIYKKTS